MSLLKREDLVQVISGADKGKRGKVLRVDHDKYRVIVQGVGLVYKHLKRSQKHPNGGRSTRLFPACRPITSPAGVQLTTLAPPDLAVGFNDSQTTMGALPFDERFCPPTAAADHRGIGLHVLGELLPKPFPKAGIDVAITQHEDGRALRLKPMLIIG